MAEDNNMQEFVKSWRVVSETLLQAVLNILQSPMTIIPPSTVAQSPVSQSDAPVQSQSNQQATVPSQPDKEKVGYMYTVCPIRMRDGSFIFRNLKDEPQEGSIFKITEYSDGTCDIEIHELSREACQVLKDNQKQYLPAAVGSVEGEISEKCHIVNTKPGKGIMDDDIVRVTEPLEVKFQ